MAEQGYVVLVTVGSQEEGVRIARELVDRREAACVTILPQIRSIYRWKDEICDEAEHLLLIKTTQSKYSQLQKSVAELHSYETPECIALPITDSLPAYFQWLVEQVS